MSKIKYNIDKLDAFKGKLKRLLMHNATERYIEDDVDNPDCMYLFNSKDLAYCFLSPQQKIIYRALSYDFQTTNQISLKTDIPSKNLASILLKMQIETNLIVRDNSIPKRMKWRKL